MLRPPMVKNNADDYKNERLNDFIDQIDSFDIICLQEVFNYCTNRKKKLIKDAFKKGYFHLYLIVQRNVTIIGFHYHA